MKKILAVLTLVASVLCISPSAFASADWFEIYRDDTYIISVDRETLKYKGGKIFVWEKYIYRNDNMRKELSRESNYKKLIGYSLEYKEYHVKNKTYRFLRTIDYDRNGDVLGSPDTSGPAIGIVPGTFGDGLLDCYKKFFEIR